MKILFACSEVYPLIKTGGLADVAGGLPTALHQLGHDVRIIVPAYTQAMNKAGKLTLLYEQKQPLAFRLLEGKLGDNGAKVIFVDIPKYFARVGGPYATEDGIGWPDNAQRFTAFCKAIVAVAKDQTALNWRPDTVHCNDWQTGLVPALLKDEPNRPALIFTIHNMAYQGLFSKETFKHLDLPENLWSLNGMEFHDQFSFIKGGILYSEIVNTVSPTYAKQILTAEFSYGLEGTLNGRADRLLGILNGIDYEQWNPATDTLLAEPFSYDALDKKLLNKTAIQKHFRLPTDNSIPLIGIVGRMVEQKGYDLILDALPILFSQKIQVVILGSGDRTFEQGFTQLAKRFPYQLGVQVGYDEALAHLIEGGADMFLMPSRFEPCGLNQIYSQRYGTVPIVHHTGGLVDSVIDVSDETLANSTATGFHFYQPSADALIKAVTRALNLFSNQTVWRNIVRAGMAVDFSWEHAAREYLAIYEKAKQYQAHILR